MLLKYPLRTFSADLLVSFLSQTLMVFSSSILDGFWAPGMICFHRSVQLDLEILNFMFTYKQIWNLGSNPTKLLLCLIWLWRRLGWTVCSLLSPFCVCSPNSITCFQDDKSSYNSKHPFNQQNSTSYYLQTYIAKFLVSDKQIKLATNKQIRYQNKMYFQQTAVSKTLFINSIYSLRLIHPQLDIKIRCIV